MGKKQKKPGKGKEKTEKKTAKAAEKRKRREEKAVGEEDDIDAILAKIKKEEAKKLEVHVEDNVPAPSPRCNCSVTVNPLKDSELIIYGGEYYNGDKTFVYGDLYRHSLEKNEWKLVSSPNSPPPRSAHQAVAWKNQVFVFGGEFTSPNQERFHHYKDLWRLDLNTNSWEQLQLKGGPSARSGHRMVLYKHKLILFGGFYDTLREVRYYNDLHVLDLDDYKWLEVKPKPGQIVPPPRSAFQMAVYQDEVFLYGGYFKDHKEDKDGSDKGVVYADMWKLDPRTWEWDKVKKAGSPPSQRAGFSLCVHKKRAIMFGGVVDSDEKDVLKSTFLNAMYSFQMDNRRWYPLEIRKPKQPKTKGGRGAKTPAAADGNTPSLMDVDSPSEDFVGRRRRGRRGEGSEGNHEGVEEASRERGREYDFAEGEGEEDEGWGEEGEEEEGRASGKGEELESMEEGQGIEDDEPGAAEEESAELAERIGEVAVIADEAPLPASSGNGKAIKTEESAGPSSPPAPPDPTVPCGRINAALVVSGNVMYLYGGVVEVGDREVTLDDMWTLNLDKLDGWKCIREATETEWVEPSDDEEDDESDSSSDESEGASSDDDDSDNPDAKKAAAPTAAEAAAAVLRGEGARMSRKDRKVQIDKIRADLGLADSDRTPLPGESLKEFFARTSMHWQKAAYEHTQRTGKELRRDGFELAENRFKELRPVLDELERLEAEQKAEEEELAKAAAASKAKGKRPSAKR